MRRSLLDRLLDKVQPEPNSGCWLWVGGVNESGYGVIGLGTREQGTDKAHRVSWRLRGGEYARLYGVSRSAVYEIWRGKNWASLAA